MVDARIIQAAASAFIHSLWIGLLITSLLMLLTHSGILKGTRKRYIAHFAGLTSLAVLTASAFVVELNAIHLTDNHGIQTYNLTSPVNSIRSSSTGSNLNWQNMVVLFWFMGMLVYGCVQVMGLRRLWTTLRATLPATEEWQIRARTLCSRLRLATDVRLVTSGDITVPFVFGVFHPLIVLPANYFTQLTPRELESILLHEIAHIAHNDFLLNLIQVGLESFLFFNPATWWLSKEIRKYREFYCDDDVWSDHFGSTYLRALYKAACISTTTPNHSIALFHNKSELIMRVKRMSYGKEPATSLRTAIVGVIGLVFISALFAFQLVEDQRTSDPEILLAGLELDLTSEENHLNAPDLSEVYPIELLHRNTQVAVGDTHPPSKRMLELQAEIERVSEEIEAISERMEVEIETNVEAEVEKIEAIAEQMEAMAEEHEEWVEREFENSPEMQRIEEIAESIEEQYEELEERIEEQHEAAIENLEEMLEVKEEEYENYPSLSEEDRQKLDKEMQELTSQLQIEMQRIQEAHQEMIQNGQMEQMQAEMERLQETMSQKHLKMEPMQAELQKLHDEMMVHQQTMQATMTGRIQKFQSEIESHHMELQRLQEELEIEVAKWHREHDDD